LYLVNNAQMNSLETLHLHTNLFFYKSLTQTSNKKKKD